MSAKTRFGHLDGIRGLAALTVFLAHCMAMLATETMGSVPAQLAEKIKWLAVPAVDMFFVLSGFCLMYSLERRAVNALTMGQFLVKRVFRIYPTYLAAVLFAFIGRQYFNQPESLGAMSEWFQSFWSGELTTKDLIDHVLLILPFNSSGLNPVIWTLSVEMRMSLVFPIIGWMLQRGFGARGGLGLLAVCIGIIVGRIDYLLYFPLFAIGAAVARYRETLLRWVPRSLVLALLLVLAPGLLLVLVRTVVGAGIMSQARFIHLGIGLASAYLILVSMAHQRLSRLLEIAPVRYLGNISYSLYLVHFPVLLLISMWLAPRVPMGALWAISLVGSIVVARMGYRYIEKPTQRLGYHLAEGVGNAAVAWKAAC